RTSRRSRFARRPQRDWLLHGVSHTARTRPRDGRRDGRVWRPVHRGDQAAAHGREHVLRARRALGPLTNTERIRQMQITNGVLRHSLVPSCLALLAACTGGMKAASTPRYSSSGGGGGAPAPATAAADYGAPPA